ncbi:Malto-oligosyltrehalose trehalohydrolase [Legionella busanensis]|uniref:Malto-oligosyltrehalose trehalohydrolase n=1 Tax=Legionella busanensis TaxID=190655 RepID=A0A378JLB9_9GAMM|nr:malto-oligosyltrehalose trehalohydrolase [Legionella busanensis]STX51531.1 Malto-oligosyltrehalose trehalohydrolase [Legionella busanensis]
MTPREYLDKRRMPIGAEFINKGVHFRVWAPKRNKISLILNNNKDHSLQLTSEGNGYFSIFTNEAKEGDLYGFQLDKDTKIYPDPASKYQPKGPHNASEIVNPKKFKWTDQRWRGVKKEDAIIYEMHIGTFTQEGTFLSAANHLEYLADLGITVIEMMPIAEFAGEFGWGYDGVDLFAPMHTYGKPDDLRYFINRAHELNISVILDVVYNHLGPDGNYLRQFSDGYFSNKYSTDWGEAINFDEDAAEVREYFLANAKYWIDEFHFDGLRIDASQNIYDTSKIHILQEINVVIRQTAPKRFIYLIAENEPQDTDYLRAIAQGGLGFDALWNDDFHHTAQVLLTGKREAYYTDYTGCPQEFISVIKYGFLYQGQWYKWQKKTRGKPTFDLAPTCFIHFLENHDQIANSVYGKRIHKKTNPSSLRAMTAYLLLSPQTPLLFQGQEFATSSPFNYFADHKPEIAKKVYQGRLEFFRQFPSVRTPEVRASLPNPIVKETFINSKLDLSEREKNATWYQLHKDLIALRKSDKVFNSHTTKQIDGAVLSPQAFVIRFFSSEGDRLMIINLGTDLNLDPAPEPLLAPPIHCYWELYWSSEDPKYGGHGTIRPNIKDNWYIPGFCTMILKPKELT